LDHTAYQDLIAYAVGELNQEQADAVGKHTATCPECAATVARFRLARSLVTRAPFEAPANAALHRAYSLQKPSRRAPVRGRLPNWLARIHFLKPDYLLRPPSRLALARLLVGMVLASALLLSGTGIMVAAAQEALPGDVLYPVKTTDEAFQLAISSGAIAKAELHLRFAQNRVNEIRALGALHRYNEVSPTTSAYEREITQIAEQLAQASRDRPEQADALLPQVEKALVQNADVLSGVGVGLSGDSKADIERAINLSKATLSDVRHEVLLATPTAGPASATPTMTLTPTPTASDTPTWTPTAKSLGGPRPKGTGEPAVTSIPGQTPQPGGTLISPDGMPEPDDTPQPTDTSQAPGPLATPTEQPGPNVTPGQSGTPGPTGTPGPDSTTDPSGTPGPGNTPSPNGTPSPGITVGPNGVPSPKHTPKPSHTPKPTRTD
jgi:Domain of unknown function (DUF5667)